MYTVHCTVICVQCVPTMHGVTEYCKVDLYTMVQYVYIIV